MSKLVISRLFLYRYRFFIGYIVLGLAFVALVLGIPLLSPAGLSEAEMSSVVASYNLHFSSVTSGDLVDLPYHILQKLCILAFGMTPYVIKLPSIIIGLLLGFLLILLLNRWFKSNVALLASILTVLSTPFLYLAGSGTPLIMLVFWPTLLLWLGSKIQGEKEPNPLFCYVFALALLLSIYTPHLIYLVVFIILFTLWNPHLRFTVKSLPKVPLIAMGMLLLAGFAMWLTNLFSSSSVALSLFFAKDFSFNHFFANVKTGFAPFFFLRKPIDGVFLSPLFGLAEIALALTGLFSTTKGFFASRNAIASCFIVFAVVLAGLTPESALLMLLPFAILTAHGLRYVLEKWYSLFPENPYARIFAIFPLSVLLALMIFPSLNHYVYGYRYAPAVATEFSTDLDLVAKNLNEETFLLLPENTLSRQFFTVYEDRTHALNLLSDLSFLDKTSAKPAIATLGRATSLPEGYRVSKIITSPKSDNSDRIYIYRYISNS
ncbi:glycosyltransferase family 39 protein [Candidatus Saccharibacteria bacterium]|nr:glycosyltransferase family 39 protein [Candidatus Saccharibacteria bacterium]